MPATDIFFKPILAFTFRLVEPKFVVFMRVAREKTGSARNIKTGYGVKAIKLVCCFFFT